MRIDFDYHEFISGLWDHCPYDRIDQYCSGGLLVDSRKGHIGNCPKCDGKGKKLTVAGETVVNFLKEWL